MVKKKYNIITMGGATRDIMFYTDEGMVFSNPRKEITRQKLLAFEYGAKVNVKEVYFTLGGGACNTVISFSRLGLKTATLISVGDDDNGKAVLKSLREERVDTKFVQTRKDLKTAFSFILTGGKYKEHTAFLFRGASNKLDFKEKDLAKFKTDWFHISHLSGSNWKKLMNTAVRKVKKEGIKMSFNPGNEQLAAGKKGLKNILKATEVLILNKDEAIELVVSGVDYLKGDKKSLNKTSNLLKILKEWGPKNVVITEGKKGASAYDGHRVYRAEAFGKKVVDTTGVGDAFGSSFVAGLIIKKGDIKKALKYGVINSGSVVSEVGAQNGLLKRKQIESKLNKAKIK